MSADQNLNNVSPQPSAQPPAAENASSPNNSTKASPTDSAPHASAVEPVAISPDQTVNRTAPTTAPTTNGSSATTSPASETAQTAAAGTARERVQGREGNSRAESVGAPHQDEAAQGGHTPPRSAESSKPPNDESESEKSNPVRRPGKQSRWRRRPLHVPTREEALASLSALMRATVLGTIPSDDAKTARAILETILRHLPSTSKARTEGSAIDIDRLRAIAHLDPTLLDIVAPLLSEEEIDDLFHEPTPAGDTGGEPHGSDDTPDNDRRDTPPNKPR